MNNIDVVFIKENKYIKINYDFNSDDGNAYIKIIGFSINVYYDKITNMNINKFNKKSKTYSIISFKPEEIENQKIIDWDIIKEIYSYPLSTKKWMNKNEMLLKNFLNKAKKDFKKCFIKMYGA